LAKDSSYTARLSSARIPAVAPGTYRVIVRPDILDVVYEGTKETNNQTVSVGSLVVTVESLQLGVAKPIQLATAEERLFQVAVGQGETLRVRVTGVAGASNELFVRGNAVPTGAVFDAAYEGPLQSNQIAVVPTTDPGIYYVLVRGNYEPGAAADVSLLA